MNKEVISDKQGIAMFVLFIVGASSIFLVGSRAKENVWLAFIIAFFMVLPMLLIFSRLHYIYPGKDLFDIIEICFGKFIGKFIMIIFVWYSFFWAADVLNNFGQFIRLISLEDTPKIILIIGLSFLCAWGINEGLNVISRWAKFFFVLVIISTISITVLIIPQMDLNNIRPVLADGLKPVLIAAFDIFTFPFIQTVAFTMAFTNFESKKSPYKVYIKGILIGGSLLLLISLTNTLVLGSYVSKRLYYPTYGSIVRISVGDMLQRVEVILSVTFIIGGFVKISLLFLCVCKGITKIFSCANYRFIVTPITLLIITFSYFQYESIMEYFEFNMEIWPYYFLPYNVIFPIIIYIIAEIKHRKIKT
jgi:spore germination protein KB